MTGIDLRAPDNLLKPTRGLGLWGFLSCLRAWPGAPVALPASAEQHSLRPLGSAGRPEDEAGMCGLARHG
jgi:hypothetical protein